MLVLPLLETETRAQSDTNAYAVTYVAALPSARGQMVAALKKYRESSRTENGYAQFDLLEQIGRPGHFAIIETWKDPKAVDAHRAAASLKQLHDALQPIRVSDYDERPYKTLTIAPAAAGANAQAIHVVSHVDSVPQGDVQGLLKRLADASRKERGCLRFDILQSTTRPNHFTVVEIWNGQNALDAHAAASHTKQYREEFQPVSGSPLDERVYKAVE
jgi:quinol monooxygenase YgiN